MAKKQSATGYEPIAAFYAAEDVDDKIRILAYDVPEAFLANPSALELLALIRPDLQRWHWFSSTIKSRCYTSVAKLEALVDDWRKQGQPAGSHLDRESGNALRQRYFAPLQWFAAGLVHEGNVIFAGKSKRGKSMLALNLAISLATGANVFQQYEVAEPIKVAYCALEDGKRRVQNRLNQMDPGHSNLDNLELIFTFPRLNEGGIDELEALVKEGYQVIIIDILAKVEQQGKNGTKDYLETYRMFDPIQALRNRYNFTLIMMTHLRKAEALDSMEEAVMGSTAYIGAQDAVWVFSRNYGADLATLEVLSKDMPEKKIELRFDADHLSWAYLGEGDEHFMQKDAQRIIEFMREENTPQSVQDILTGLGWQRDKYESTRKRLQRMVADGLLVRTDRGKFAALPKAGWEDIAHDLPF